MKSISMAALAMMGGALLSGAAQAQNFTAQIDAGGSDYARSVFCDPWSCDHRDTFLRVQLGYRFANGLGVELGRSSYGEIHTNTGNQLSGYVKVSALSLAASYQLALWRDMGLVTRLGVARQRATIRHHWFHDQKPEHHVQPLAGLGLTYAFTPAWRMELGVDYTRMTPFKVEFDDEKRSLRAYYLGTQFSF